MAKTIPLNSGCIRPARAGAPSQTAITGPERAVDGASRNLAARGDVLRRRWPLVLARPRKMSVGDGSYANTKTSRWRWSPEFPGAPRCTSHCHTRITVRGDGRRFHVWYSARRPARFRCRHMPGDGGRECSNSRRRSRFLLSEQLVSEPFGCRAGSAGARGQNLLDGKELAGATSFDVTAGARLTLLTPGGGGFGAPGTGAPGTD